jgi:hypothetical protein
MRLSAPRLGCWLRVLPLLVACAALGCQALPALERFFAGGPVRPVEAAEVPPPISPEIYRRVDQERVERLEAEVERLREDLQQAEEVLISIESGLRGNHSRAEAASSLAEARIQVERAARRTPWRPSEILEARGKLDDADGHIQQGNFGAALFFVYSAQRIAGNLEEEAKQVAAAPAARLVRAGRVNLRSGPSTQEAVVTVLTRGTPVFEEGSELEWTLVRTTHGRVGWVHSGLLERP